MTKPGTFDTAEACVDAVLEKVGKRIVLGLPLGIGKANQFANAMYARAEQNPTGAEFPDQLLDGTKTLQAGDLQRSIIA